MLCVGRRLTKNDCARRVLNVVSRSCDSFPVGLHEQLLQIRREAVHVLVERRHQVGLSSEKVRVPDSEQTCNDWDVFMEWSLQEVLVHCLSTGKEFVEVLVAN